MWNVVRRETQSRLGRLCLAALAVALGVAFVTMSFVLTDTSRRQFESLFAELDAKADLVIMDPAAIASGAGLTGQQVPIPSSVMDSVRETVDVAAVDGRLIGPAQILAPDGRPVRTRFGSTIAMSWSSNAELTPLNIRSGRRPSGADEFAIDARTADRYDYVLGSTVSIAATRSQDTGDPFQRKMTLVGILGFGKSDSFGSSTVIGLDATFAAAFFGVPNAVSAVLVKADESSDLSALQRALQAKVGRLAVLTTEQAQAETNKQIQAIADRAVQLLLLFAALGVISGVVMIANTFSMIIAQRQRALALFRALGASRRQLHLLLAGESIALALIGAAAGIALGVGAAVGILRLISVYVYETPNLGAVVQSRTVVIAIGVAFIGTALGALVPTMRTSNIRPVPAMSDELRSTGKPKRSWRFLGAGLFGIVAAISVLQGEYNKAVFSNAEYSVFVALVAAVSIGLAAAFLASLLSGPVARALAHQLGSAGVLGVALLGVGFTVASSWSALRIVIALALVMVLFAALLPFRSSVGTLAARNAGRHAIRTGRTAVSLMIGIAVLAVLAVLVTSLKRTVSVSVLNGIKADVIVADSNSQFIPPETEAALREAGIAEPVPIRLGRATLGSTTIEINGVEPALIERVFDLDLSSGRVSDLADGRVLINAARAAADGLHVGDSVSIGSPLFLPQSLEIVGVFDQTVISPLGAVDIFTTPATVQILSGGGGIAGVYVTPKSGERSSDRKADVIAALDEAGLFQPSVYTRAEFAEHSRSQYDFALYALFGLVIIGSGIALLSIANTMFLSVYERTREVGLLRAVGMQRPQVRSMIRAEGAIIAVLGGMLGVLVGAIGAIILVRALRVQGLSAVEVPWAQLALFLALATCSGVGAALFPAWRASRLPILDAISVELHDSGDRK